MSARRSGIPVSLIAFLVAAAFALPASAELSGPAAPELSGAARTSVEADLGADYPLSDGDLAFGAEQYANLRLEAPLGGRGALFAAVNLVAAAGSSVPRASPGLAASPFVVGQGYAAALELERLYYRIEGESFDFEAGLMRLPFGFGQAWSPSDFLSSRNPLLPDARPRGSLAAAASAYPGGDWKLKAFAAAGKDSLETGGEGSVAGLAAELHLSAASVQALYAIEADDSGLESAAHRFGLSIKAEAGAGIVLDALYRLDGDWLASGDYHDREWSFLRGLEASLGADYSWLDGKLYALVQYLYRGGSALDPEDGLDRLYSHNASWADLPPADRLGLLDPALPLGELNRRDYLYASLTFRIDDYSAATLSCVGGLDDASLVPSLSAESEIFQGLTLGISARLHLDARTFSSDGERGELGPIHSGSVGSLSASARLRF